MLGLYLAAALVGGGLLVFSLLVGDHDATDVDAPDVDAPDVDVDVGDVGDAADDFDVRADGAAAGSLLLGFFRPRNFIFLLATFGITGLLLTWLGTPADTAFALAVGMGAFAFLLTHIVFTWLKRSDLVVDAISEADLEGHFARVVLPLGRDALGRIVTLAADREFYLSARLAPEASDSVPVGHEVVILSVDDGVAEVVPFGSPGLPMSES